MKWKFTTLSGVNVYVHWSFWLLPIWFGLSTLAAGGGLPAVVTLLTLIFSVFGCVVLHEMGHALAARHYGIGTRDITLYPIGGVALLDRIPSRPVQELVIAVAGPLVNVVIAALLMVIIGAGPGFAATFAAPTGSILFQLLAINIGLVLFNLLPAFPMDGGRVLRALLAIALPYRTATQIAGRVGQAMAIVFGIAGLFSQNLSLLLVAGFVFLAATGEMARVMQVVPSYLELPIEPRDTDREIDHLGDSITWLGDVQTLRDGDGGRIYVTRRGWPDRG